MPVAIRLEYSIGGATGEAVVEELAAAFERAGDEVKDFGTHVFPEVIPALESGVKRQFDARGGGSTGAWAPLSEAYAAWKANAYPGQPLLERTGALVEALTESSSANAFREYSKDTLGFGTSGLEYASFHQTGTSKMPVRPPFDFDAQFDKDFDAAARMGMRKAFRAARLEEAGVEVVE